MVYIYYNDGLGIFPKNDDRQDMSLKYNWQMAE